MTIMTKPMNERSFEKWRCAVDLVKTEGGIATNRRSSKKRLNVTGSIYLFIVSHAATCWGKLSLSLFHRVLFGSVCIQLPALRIKLSVLLVGGLHLFLFCLFSCPRFYQSFGRFIVVIFALIIQFRYGFFSVSNSFSCVLPLVFSQLIILWEWASRLGMLRPVTHPHSFRFRQIGS